ncbi:T9SS type A sorting domain-containing protein [bacterium]|nr:T9SS type A sorting domain-containing protein [bacterium]
MRRLFLMLLAVLILLIPQFVQAWEWEVDTSYLNPTGYPVDNIITAVWSIYDPGPQNELSWVMLESDGTVLRLIPQWNESGNITGWTEDQDHFAGINAPISAYQIFFGQWNPYHDGPQLMFISPDGGASIWVNFGTLENPDWQTSINFVPRTIEVQPPYGIGTGNVDGDDLVDLLYLYQTGLIHYEWDETAEEWIYQRTLMEFDPPVNAMAIRVADLDGDGDTDCILTNSNQNEYYSYQLLVNQGTYFQELRTLPAWQGEAIPVDLDGDEELDLAFVNGYAKAVEPSHFQWHDPTIFISGLPDAIHHTADGSIRTINRPTWYEATGYHWTYRTGELTDIGFQTTWWAGYILSDEYGTGGTTPRTGSIFDDMNGDGVLDLLVITNPGEMTAFRNDGSEDEPFYVPDETLFPLNLFSTPWNIQGHDLDGNGYVDYMFFRENNWMIYMGGAEEDGSRFWDRNDNLASTILQLGTGNRVFGDVDGDGDADLIYTVGSFSQLLLNEERDGERVFDQEPGALPEDVGFYSGTYCFDFDNDGTEDIAQGKKVYLSRLHGDAAESDPLPYQIYLAVAPNPFNSMTRVTLAIPVHEEVRAGLYNMLGQQVANLNQGVLPAGVHHISINGSNFASGVYLLRLEAYGQVHQRRLVLVK